MKFFAYIWYLYQKPFNYKINKIIGDANIFGQLSFKKKTLQTPHSAPKLFSYVLKELFHAFSCVYIELYMHLESLESTQEAKVARGAAKSNSYASLMLSKLPACIHNLIYAR